MDIWRNNDQNFSKVDANYSRSEVQWSLSSITNTIMPKHSVQNWKANDRRLQKEPEEKDIL